MSQKGSTTGCSTNNSEAVLRWLGTPAAHPNEVAAVDVVETHISWVVLTEHHAYKLKKPVRFDFLDFSTVEKRRLACEEELRANRRLAADVYLDVLPVTIDQRGSLRFGGDGPVADWVVKMRRLPADRTLDHLIRANQLQPGEVAAVASRLTDFYLHSAPLAISAVDYRRMIAEHVRANREVLLDTTGDLPSEMVKRVHASQLRLLEAGHELLDARVAERRIVDGHGDLRPEHVYLVEPPVVIDCIEFNREFRKIDVVDELCFLAMECDYLGAADVGRQILDAYLRASGDCPQPRLLNFYRCYRACVRAKVAMLRSRQLTDNRADEARREAARYLHLADQAAACMARPLLLVVRGLSGTGKSTLARALSERLGLDLLQTDVIRREMFGSESVPANYGSGTYRPELRERVYREMFDRARPVLGQGGSLILDGTFLTTASRATAQQLAGQCGAALLVAECRCPLEVARQRIRQRAAAAGDASEVRPDLLARQAEVEEQDPRGLSVCHVDSTQDLSAQADSVLRQLGRLDAATTQSGSASADDQRLAT